MATASPAPVAPTLAFQKLPRLLDDDGRLDAPLRRDLLPGLRRDSKLRLVVELVEQPDLKALGASLDALHVSRDERKRLAWDALGGLDARRQPFVDWLVEQGATDVVAFRTVNRVAFKGSKALALALVSRPEVVYTWGHILGETPEIAAEKTTPNDEPVPVSRWALDALGARECWKKGFRGRGVVVAVMDSGVPADSPALSGRLIEAGNQSLPEGERVPGAHGGAVLAAAVGAKDFGVAPEARWTSIDPVPTGQLDPETLAKAFDWLLGTARPDVVAAPWDVPIDEGLDEALVLPIGSLRTAGLAIVFPAGNTGPAAGSNRAPANLVALPPDGAPALSVGGINEKREIYQWSSRGQNVHDGSIFPLVTAPAERVVVLEPARPGQAEVRSGTSYACGFTAGALAIVMGADPSLTGPKAEALLRRTATDLGTAGPDNLFGAGLIDLPAALKALGK